MSVGTSPDDAVHLVATRIPLSDNGHCPRVAIDGPDGAGKTYFADELAAILQAQQRPVVRVSLDDFHNTRAVRYRLGHDSPEGFWLDSYHYERFHSDVLTPFSPGGSRSYRVAAHDLGTDAILNPVPRTAAPGTVLVVDGIFLHRNELAERWDLSVFLDVPFSETARRMALRDGTNPDPEHPSMRRYVEAQRRYFRECNPQQRATVLIDNRGLGCPVVVRA
ncbi:uridine kinase [Mycobacterium sp. CBMA293]|nr:uridine kinase [Mycolicibacterium sp. CBMA 360]MUL58561.1 uridine kinase [Mycolicibacterium sp. CBMA 335]MUL74019.1 uridine kinase [Mycolicibacterium sp. CBMA 311]MUL93444.1 uridine kinase [Mycolicibacterium sp. CBMA 230]MUM04660.1 uridine kinase [Mycolicibacterium sp. CBMA 213]MUM10287.1 uridine kinase [Mycolicibacterium sp. CBMA 293]MUM34888.1 uridine kinase [Mycolicibacterium sp. CBMA 361]